MKTLSSTGSLDESRWSIPSAEVTSVFQWKYDGGRSRLLSLYEKGKTKQWDANTRLDWSLQVNPENPLGFPDFYVVLHGSDIWERMDAKERGEARFHLDAWRFSQFLHGEQGALVCASRVVQTVPDLDAKFYAATQVFDEARHVEVFSRYLREKLGLIYPINPSLKTLLEQALGDSRWDLTYLAMQVLIEGLALAAFGLIRDFATEPLGRSLTAYVMQDEARHVAFGRLALKDLYPQLTEQERDEREQFAVEACYLMRDRFLGQEVFEELGLDVAACIEHMRTSELMREYQKMLFSRIVPTLKDIGLWGPRLRGAFADMGVLEFAELDTEAQGRADEDVAHELEQLRETRDTYVKGVTSELEATH
ncbi:ferritin-like domain-containing protein [Hyalangium versicolor]|uniref:ferritin-like domain-containing protein n=1 Tax=Hyalangium versicolor TaxID=2861190 RepID=UPI001CCF91F1|nr:ferritin-like domain-containing protein [Hyalangium versicolor]